MNNYPLIETVGLEFESCFTHENNPPLNDITSYVRNSHDASIQTDVFTVGTRACYLMISDNKIYKIFGGKRTVLGNELITIPLYEKDKIAKVVNILSRNLFNTGETTRGFRESLHIHICYSYNLEILKRILEASLLLENFLFNIGGNGYTFRGLKNNSIYCRPFSNYGPPVVLNNNEYVQILELNNLFKSKTIDEFWSNYGGLAIGNTNRYHPARYFYINLYALLIHGTLEFRVFNKTLDADRITALIELCQAICTIILDENKFISLKNYVEPKNIFVNTNYKQNINVLERLGSLYKFKNKNMDTLADILKYTPEFKLDSNYVLTHVRNFLETNHAVLPSKIKKTPIDKSLIKETVIEDIHTLRQANGVPAPFGRYSNPFELRFAEESTANNAYYTIPNATTTFINEPQIAPEDIPQYEPNDRDRYNEVVIEINNEDSLLPLDFNENLIPEEYRGRIYMDEDGNYRIGEE